MLRSITNDLKLYAKDLTILVAEDEEMIAEETFNMLDHFFKKVYMAKDGLEALELYKQYKCDMVLTDLNMPRMDGVELAKEIRILNKEQVIFVNSAYIDHYVVELFDIGIQGLFIKPFKASEFFQKILVHCENIQLKKEMQKYRDLISDMTKKIETPRTIKPSLKVTSIIKQDEKAKVDDFIDNFGKTDEIDDTFWKHICSDIAEINHEFEDAISRISLRGINEDMQYDLIRVFIKYNHAMLLIPQMANMSIVFRDLAETIENKNFNGSFNYAFEENIHLIEFMYEDIIKFFDIVFVEKSTENTNYLTDSLASSVVQLKTKLGFIELEEEELEFF